ncbi:MAG: hypothetical protein M3220_22530 [Chloroflexota bacterium]|nr:hypothetical protein [Chloroflexota bacterium]
MRSLTIVWIPLLMLLLLTGCASAAPEPVTGGSGTGDEAASPATATAPAGVVAWDRSPDAIIMQYREEGGFRAPPQATTLPEWTLYGDGFVVWTEEGEPTPGFTAQVWTGTLSDEQIEELIALASESDFWSLEPSYGTGAADVTEETLTLETPFEDLPSATLTIDLQEREQSVLVYPVDFEGAPESYRTVRDRLLETRPADASRFTPSTFRLEAQPLSQAEEPTAGEADELAAWPFLDIDLVEVVEEPLSLSDEGAMEVAEFALQNDYLAEQDGMGYRLGVFAEPPRPITTIR